MRSEGFLDCHVDTTGTLLADAHVETQIGLRSLVDEQTDSGAAAGAKLWKRRSSFLP